MIVVFEFDVNIYVVIVECCDDVGVFVFVCIGNVFDCGYLDVEKKG